MEPHDVQPVLTNLESVACEATKAFQQARSSEEVEQARVRYLGLKHGRMEEFEAFLKSLPAQGKKAFGKRFNEVKQALKQAHVTAKERVGSFTLPSSAPARMSETMPAKDVRENRSFDFSLPGLRPKIGRKH